VQLGRLAVETGIFPLYEIDHGRYKLSMEFSPLRPITEYTKLQGRFRHLTADVLQQIQDKVVQKYEELREKSSV
jgi:pyruvate ferredoxin oxidoreductase beta subunit